MENEQENVELTCPVCLSPFYVSKAMAESDACSSYICPMCYF